jgi:peptidoglycan/xylan/chitin deacetylase (PgdA/CDA1 family)/folate-dependent phosphoribosylglycinamide formyltransferase PurN
VIVFSSMPPIEPFRLMDRLAREVPGAEVAGLLYERRPPKSLGQRARGWLKRFREPGYPAYVLGRVADACIRQLHTVGLALLKFAQASSVAYRDPAAMSLDDLAAECRRRGWPFHLTTDIHSAESLQFVRAQNPDLGMVLGTRILKPALYEIPAQGSVNVHKRKVPDYRGGGPIGLWEMLDGQTEIGVTVHRVAEKVDTGAVVREATIPIDLYDTLSSLGLKADLIGEELLLATARDILDGALAERPQAGTGKTFKSPKAHELRSYEEKLAALRPAWRAPRSRPVWKLLLRSTLYLWALPVRNWVRRFRKQFPVVILYHHLVSDRPHPMAQPTEDFLRQLRYLKRHYRLVTLREAVDLLAAGAVHQPTAVLTFDDGYRENFLCLRAALRVEPAPVTLFVCPQLLERGEPFPHDVRDQRLDFPPLSPAELRRMDAEGFEIASHTRTHFDCGAADVATLHDEIAGSRADLERLLGHPVHFFSFPWGGWANMSEPARLLAEQHYDAFFSAFGGVNFPGGRGKHLKRQSHPFRLWELELALQNLLEREKAPSSAAPQRASAASAQPVAPEQPLEAVAAHSATHKDNHG